MLNSLFSDYVQTLDSALENTRQQWFQQAELEAIKNRERRYQQGRGPCNIFILDTSSNVGEDGFMQMKDTFSTIMDEYAGYPEMDENVAVVICGRATTFKHYYSNNYEQLKHCIDDIEYGGPCPLTAAFILSLGAVINRTGYSKMMGDFYVHPRLIVISAGRPTDFTLMNNMKDIVLDHLHQMARNIGRRHPIYCIPVGKNRDTETLGFISALSRGGKIVYPHEAKQFAKYTKNMHVASLISISSRLDRETLMYLISQTMPGKEFTDMDKDDIFEICTQKSLFVSMDEIEKDASNSDKNSLKEWNPHMPPLGSRVRRSPDSTWNTQERHVIGTVTEHSKEAGWLTVQWDRGSRDKYRYGSSNVQEDKYEVIVCDEPRILEHELIAIGCLVYRGPDWAFGDQDGGEGSIGSVYMVTPNGIADVRWQNGKMNNYRFGFDGKFDLSICDPFSMEANRFLHDQKRRAASKLPESMQYIYGDTDFPRSREEKKLTHREETNTGIFLKAPKGIYFKNDSVENDNTSDLEIDCSDVSAMSVNCDHWVWKDQDGIWNHYPRKINEKLMKNFKRNPASTVVITIKEDLYRVVLAKNMQINLTTREKMEVKLVKNEV